MLDEGRAAAVANDSDEDLKAMSQVRDQQVVKVVPKAKFAQPILPWSTAALRFWCILVHRFLVFSFAHLPTLLPTILPTSADTFADTFALIL
jgi:hypothetical protein